MRTLLHLLVFGPEHAQGRVNRDPSVWLWLAYCYTVWQSCLGLPVQVQPAVEDLVSPVAISELLPW